MIKNYVSPCGVLRLGADASGLILCDWVGDPVREQRSLAMTSADMSDSGTEIIAQTVRQLDEYFAGERQRFSLPIRLQGTEFQQRVWGELMKIPFGLTTSYSDLARRIGRPDAVRAVAGAVGANPISIIVPCHRIIGADGRLTGYAGGLGAKRFLLELEQRVSGRD